MEPKLKAPETIKVTTRSLSCDGGGGALGHPKVYFQIAPDDNSTQCGYCGKMFVLKDSAV